MKLQAGMLLSAQLRDGSIFDDALVYLVSYDAAGAVGVIINKPFGRALNELHEFRHSPSWPLYNGGPVDTGHLFFLHRNGSLIQGGVPVQDGVCWGGDFSAALRGINNGTLRGGEIKLFVGYCGWDAGDLEAELAAGEWLPISVEAAMLF